MRWLLVAVLTVPVFAPATYAQASTRRQITALEDDWIKGVIKRDAKAFSRLLAPGFLYTENDQVSTRDQLIKDIITGSDTVTSGRNEDLTVTPHGNTAIATGWLIMKGRGKAGAFERRYRYTDTWMKLDGRWRIIAAQDYLKP